MGNDFAWAKRVISRGTDWTKLNGNPAFNRKQQQSQLESRRKKKMSESNKSALEVAILCGISPEEYQSALNQENKAAVIQSLLTPEEMKICKSTGIEPLEYLKTSGALDLNTLLSQDEIATCRTLNVAPLDFYFAKKYKC
ncbi:MAG TPA: hypothetical protein VGJ93_15550 [Desulfuromonadaceae bacterium]|jgi:hypothetical protein